MVHFYTIAVKMLFAAKILKTRNKYSVVVVSTKVGGCVSIFWTILGVMCEEKVIVVSDFKEYENRIEELAKKYPNDRMLIAAYNCRTHGSVSDAIAEITKGIAVCFEMMEVLKKSPMHQSFWVKGHATAKSRV